MNDSLSDEQILEELSTIFRMIFEDDGIVARPDMTAADVARWDSLSHVDMIILVERTFKMRIPTRDVARLKNVGDLVRCIKAHLA